MKRLAFCLFLCLFINAIQSGPPTSPTSVKLYSCRGLQSFGAEGGCASCPDASGGALCFIPFNLNMDGQENTYTQPLALQTLTDPCQACASNLFYGFLFVPASISKGDPLYCEKHASTLKGPAADLTGCTDPAKLCAYLDCQDNPVQGNSIEMTWTDLASMTCELQRCTQAIDILNNFNCPCTDVVQGISCTCADALPYIGCGCGDLASTVTSECECDALADIVISKQCDCADVQKIFTNTDTCGCTDIASFFTASSCECAFAIPIFESTCGCGDIIQLKTDMHCTCGDVGCPSCADCECGTCNGGHCNSCPNPCQTTPWALWAPPVFSCNDPANGACASCQFLGSYTYCYIDLTGHVAKMTTMSPCDFCSANPNDGFIQISSADSCDNYAASNIQTGLAFRTEGWPGCPPITIG